MIIWLNHSIAKTVVYSSLMMQVMVHPFVAKFLADLCGPCCLSYQHTSYRLALLGFKKNM